MINNYYSRKSNWKAISKSDGRVIGIISNGVFRKNVIGSKHMLRKPIGWAIDKNSYMQLQNNNTRFIEIHDKESGVLYRATMDTFTGYSISINRGYGEQIALPIDYWQVFLPGRCKPQQLSLLGE